MKKIAILGSTGSIGTQTLQVIKNNENLFQVKSLVAHSDKKKLNKQAEDFHPLNYFTIKDDGAKCLTSAIKDADIVVVATRGIIAIDAVLQAIKDGQTVALANKETLVCGGELVKYYLSRYKGKLITVDSEHSAIWQCLEGNKHSQIKKLILTASGGAFKNYTTEQLKTAKAEEALKHPTWSMGQKITIDSATMMNKGLEIIEASYLFDIPQEQIEVLIHPQSIVHSMVEFCDGAVMAQMSNPDMALPIQYALTYPDRLPSKVAPLSLADKKLEFYLPDYNKFKCINLCRQAFSRGGLYPAVLNAANDVCVEKYLKNKIGFLNIANIIERVLNEYKTESEISADGLLTTDKLVKIYTENIIDGVI